MDSPRREPAKASHCVAPLQLCLGRARAYVWRFHTLRFANRLFRNVPRPCVLERPFFGYRLLVDVSRSNAQRLLYLEGQRFVAERFLLRALLRPGLSVVDIGANIGYYALLVARSIGPSGKILCIEPETDNLAELERNIRDNHINFASVLPIAAGSEDGEAYLSPGINGRITEDGALGLTVPVRRLDSVLTGRVDLIKVDVEGFEGHVLAGAERTVCEQRPDLFVEVHPAFLAAPTSLRNLFDWLHVHYPRIELFAPVAQSRVGDKLTARYRPGAGVRRIADHGSFLAACADGLHVEPFWAICRSSRPGVR